MSLSNKKIKKNVLEVVKCAGAISTAERYRLQLCRDTHTTRLQILPVKDHIRVGRAHLFVAKTITTGHTGLYTPIKQGHGRGYAATSRIQCYLELLIMHEWVDLVQQGVRVAAAKLHGHGQ